RFLADAAWGLGILGTKRAVLEKPPAIAIRGQLSRSSLHPAEIIAKTIHDDVLHLPFLHIQPADGKAPMLAAGRHDVVLLIFQDVALFNMHTIDLAGLKIQFGEKCKPAVE